MIHVAQKRYTEELTAICSPELYKDERTIASPQSAEIKLADGRRVLNFYGPNQLSRTDYSGAIKVIK